MAIAKRSAREAMPSRKRKRTERPAIHRRNRYADNPPDFSLLASLYPSFSNYVFYSRDGRARIDWTDFNATRELTRVLLHHDHGLNWWIPDGHLCPTVPNRSNYIHWIEDLLASDNIPKTSSVEDRAKGFDIGTGANCIYPLLGASLLGWSFVGTDITDVAIECADKNVKSNPHISEFIEIRKVEDAGIVYAGGVMQLSDGGSEEKDHQRSPRCSDLIDTRNVENFKVTNSEDKLDNGQLMKGGDTVELDEILDGEVQQQPSESADGHLTAGKSYFGPSILLGVVKDGETFDFCMCNPPFFESMEEAGQNPRTSCGGMPEEMICPGGEKAFISRIIEDSVSLRDSFRWYTSMVGKKSNLKFLISKLREVQVTIVKTTEFVQGQTCRWGLAWSFMPPARKLVSSHVAEKTNLSFMLEAFQRQASAFNVLESARSFFCDLGVACKSNPSSFTIDISMSNDHCEAILKNDAKNIDDTASSRALHCNLSFRISVFEQIPGALLVRGSVQERGSPVSAAFPLIFQQLEEFLRRKFVKQKVCVDCFNRAPASS